MRIEVVFVEDVLPKYRAGDVRSVAGGYARNYLIPKGFAVPATLEHRKRIGNIRKVADAKREREAVALQDVAAKLEGLQLTVKVRAGEQGRLYGSVTSFGIAGIIKESTGVDVDRRAILLSEPIRELGVFNVSVRLHQDIIPTVHVTVEDELGRQLIQSDADDTVASEIENESIASETDEIISEVDNSESDEDKLDDTPSEIIEPDSNSELDSEDEEGSE